MNIAGFQTLSLLDYPEKSCSIVFTQGCIFRCPYCHNPELIPTGAKTTIVEESVIRYLMEHKNMLDAVCITGGEPTIQVGLRRFIEHIKSIGLLVKLDTNGVHPVLVRELISAKLIDYIAMDLKNVWARYRDVSRANEATTRNCRKTFVILQESGVDHEFRTTICPGVHTEEDFFEMAGYLKDGEKYFLQQTQFKKTLETNLTEKSRLNSQNLVNMLQNKFPRVQFAAR